MGAIIFLVLMAAWPSLLVAADTPPMLSHNPFSRPSSEVVSMERRVIETDDGSAPDLPLQATMVGRVSRLANVAGRILKPGDEYQGYQLVAIHERYAVFERGGETTTVYVKPEQEEEDDE
ncbi:MAG: hypothetical protein WBM61_01320 [Woeseiaceae bacterium]